MSEDKYKERSFNISVTCDEHSSDEPPSVTALFPEKESSLDICCREDSKSFYLVLRENQELVGENEVSLEELRATSDGLCLTFSKDQDTEASVSVLVSLEPMLELGIDEIDKYDSNSTMAAVSTTDMEEENLEGRLSPSIGSVISDELSDGCGFVHLERSVEYLPCSSNSSIFSSTLSISGPSSASSTASLGLLALEVVAAENIPPSRLRLNFGGPQSPFVVVGFGRNSFRTKTLHRNNNPVWKEQLYLPVAERESNYHVNFSLYNQRALAGNMCVGKARIRLNELIHRPEQIFKLALAVQVEKEDEDKEHPCRLLIKCTFHSIDAVKRQFWHLLFDQFKQQDDGEFKGKLNLVEFESMMNCIGPDLSEETLNAIAEALGPYNDLGDFDYDLVVQALSMLTIISGSSLPENHNGATVMINQCPVCQRILIDNLTADEIIMHVFICNAREATGRVDKEMMGGFITEEHASRKWLTRLFSTFSFGGYELGKNNGNIFVHDRLSGKLVEEKMPAYVRLVIRMIYQKTGRAADAQMVRRLLQSMTVKQGLKFSAPQSKKNIEPFIKFHGLDVSEILDPLDSFSNFNEFFYRKLKPEARPPASTDPSVALCPADCRLITYPTVDEATQLWIKGTNFSISELLKDVQLGEYFEGGSVAICRLAPQDYHRFHCPFEATVNLIYHIPGAYFAVNQMAVRRPFDVLTENARTVVLLDSPQFGKVVYVPIGATMVGSINMTCNQGDVLQPLDEIGYFAFGGSTIVMVFTAGAIEFDPDLLAHSKESLETLVQVGQTLGRHPDKQSN